MKKLFDEGLSGREFGSDVLHVPGLLEWAKAKGFHLVVDPPLDDYDFAQIEALLCEIERNAYAQSPQHAAVKMAGSQATTPMLAAMSAGMDAETTEALAAQLREAGVFLAGANVHGQWRDIFRKAIAAGELVPLDSDSFLPTMKPAPAAQVEAGTSQSGGEIPGKMPQINIGKLAIKAAWQIERDTGKRATAKQVIGTLQSWVDHKDNPAAVAELTEKIPNGVRWVTSGGIKKDYDIGACQKALENWNGSRT